MNDICAEDYLPHRDRLKLIDTIILVNEDTAVTESVIHSRWPLIKKEYISPIVLIELIAQTAGIYIAWNKEKERLRTGHERGWVVGIQSASFYTHQLKIGDTISTRVSSKLSIDNYMKIKGNTFMNKNLVGDVALQLFWEESEENTYVHI